MWLWIPKWESGSKRLTKKVWLWTPNVKSGSKRLTEKKNVVLNAYEGESKQKSNDLNTGDMA